MSDKQYINLSRSGLALALGAFCAGAMAGNPSMMQLDTNEDGVISQEEAEANDKLAAGFSDTDADADGMIDASEFARFEYIQLDSNGDGVVSEEEASSHERLATNFDSADADGDGLVDIGEFARFEALEESQEQAPESMQEYEDESSMPLE